ncbi:MAG: NADPH-dependent FMN reductase [Candidatus Paceibacterota bacterium]
MDNKILNVAVIEGTTRPKRMSIHAARLIAQVGDGLDGVKTQLVDPIDFSFPGDGNDEGGKDSNYTEITKKADAFFIVVPEYNHAYPGSLKRMLDSELKNYIHKPVAFAGVSSGQWGGVRAIENLIPVVREIGMVVTFADIQFPNIGGIFNDAGELQDERYINRIKRTYVELVWMARVLKWGRQNLENKHHK